MSEDQAHRDSEFEKEKKIEIEFEKRKKEHITFALDPKVQATDRSSWEMFDLEHEAFPEINFEEVDISTSFFSHSLQAPFFISSMTAGHEQGEIINKRLAALSARHQILMGVGSQRKELSQPAAAQEWKQIRKQNPQALLMANIGATQLVTHSVDQILKLVENLEAVALIVHTNPLQEVLQKEGTPQFRGGLKSLENVVRSSKTPVVVKEVGFGLSVSTLKRLNEIGVAAVDVSGRSGTHWGKIEGLRAGDSVREQASWTFENWGRPTLEILKNIYEMDMKFQVWASGGVRSGLDVAKCIALKAKLVGVAYPWLKAALESEEKVEELYQRLSLELRAALFCTGSRNVSDMLERKVGVWRKI